MEYFCIFLLIKADNFQKCYIAVIKYDILFILLILTIININSKGGDIMPQCPSCGSDMQKRTGKFGEFWGCSKFPNCTTTVSLHDVDEKFDVPTYSHDGESYGICARCGEKDSLSDMRLCNYCQHMWDKD